jgi:hypothetical protein
MATEVIIKNSKGTPLQIDDKGRASITSTNDTVEFVGSQEITGTTGSTNDVFKSVTFVNVAGTIRIAGSSALPAGTYSFNSPNGTLAIAFDATGSTDCKLFYQK